jgi:hypothetical protein
VKRVWRIPASAALLSLAALNVQGFDRPFDRATVVSSPRATTVESNAAALLADRLHEQTGLPVEHLKDDSAKLPERGLVILIGVAGAAGRLRAFLDEQRVAPPTTREPGPEGYVIKAAAGEARVVVGAAATDPRGVLYAAGELLRRVTARGSGFEFPDNLNLRTAPAFRVRGTEVGQGDTIRELTHSRRWTDQEWRHAVLDYALAGANTFGGGAKEFDFLKSYGLMVVGHLNSNSLSGHPEWSAVEPIGRLNFVCPSIPEARRAVLDNIEQSMKNSLPYDIIRIPSGDAGGCWCEKCEPWGKTYVLMCADMAKIIHKYQPGTRVYITNQELSNAGERFIFDYLNQSPRPWLAGLYYGPGSNAISWNGTKRPDHRLDLLEYPAFGLFDRHLREMIHELPRRQSMLLFTDLTHWIASQHGFLASEPMADFDGELPPARDSWYYKLRPDPALLKVYNRRTFFARPRAYYRIFQETMRYAEGDITYSEGHHDHLHQWIWQRLMWAPHTPLDKLLEEYTRTWFGVDAAPQMAEAILQLETNLTTPLAANDGVDRYYRLVEEAGRRMPAKLRQDSYQWRQFMQKACLDKLIQLQLRRQTELKAGIERKFDAVLNGGDMKAAADYAAGRLKETGDSSEIARLREEAGRLGAESERLFGVRSEGYFNLDQDFTGLGWIGQQLGRMATAPEAEKRGIARLIARYEDPGEGGFYDDAGDALRSPHLVHGHGYSANNYLSGNVSNANRPSQRTMAYTADQARGVTFRYTGLDPKAGYRVRFAFVRPRFLARFAMLHPEKSQSIYADGKLLAANVEVPEWDARLFEYPVPRELTSDGELTVWLEKSPEIASGSVPRVRQWKRTAGWGTVVSDVWLLKKAGPGPVQR